MARYAAPNLHFAAIKALLSRQQTGNTKTQSIFVHPSTRSKHYPGLSCNFLVFPHFFSCIAVVSSALSRQFGRVYLQFSVCLTMHIKFFFTRESSYCSQRVLAIAILSVCHTRGSDKNGPS